MKRKPKVIDFEGETREEIASIILAIKGLTGSDNYIPAFLRICSSLGNRALNSGRSRRGTRSESFRI